MKIKTTVRILALMLTLLMIVPFFTACDQSTATVTPPAENGNASTSSPLSMEIPAGFLVLGEERVVDCQLVTSTGINPTLLVAVTQLEAQFKETAHASIPRVDENAPEKECEIVIGTAGRADLQKLHDSYGFQGYDFAIKVVGKKVVVLGADDWALADAIYFLINRVLCFNYKEQTVAVDPTFSYHSSAIARTDVASIDKSDSTHVYFTVAAGTGRDSICRISYAGNKGWRVQTVTHFSADFNDIGASQRLSLSLGEEVVDNTEKLTYKQEGDRMEMTAPDGTRAVLKLNPFSITIYTASGKVANEVTAIETIGGDTSIFTKLEHNEAIYGAGENYYSANHRGKQLNLFTTDIWDKVNAIYMAIPLFSSSRGSGIFINRYEEIDCDIGFTKSDTFKNTVVGSVMDCYLFATEQIADVIYGYSSLSGFAEMPEEWTYGMIVCRYSPDLSQKHSGTTSGGVGYEGVYDAIANMERFDLPWTGILAEAWGPYNASKHNDLKELCDYVHSLGKKFLVYMSVGNASSSMSGYWDDYMMSISPNGDETIKLPQTNANTNNPDVGTSGGSGRAYLDITNPEAVEWFFDTYWDYLSNEIGVDGCKIDFCEQIPENYKINFYDENMPTAGTHHWYPTAFCAMFWDMISSKPDSGMCFTRGGGIGSQRAPYMWAGDQSRRFDRLEWQLTNLLSSGLSGVPFMSHDMSGYQYNGASTDVVFEGTVFVRGTQWSAFTSNLQTHGKVRKSYDFALYGKGQYAYFTDIYRAYTKLHEVLYPYITEYSEIACTTGMPLARHLVLHWQNDKTVYDIDDEYMFGDAFLVAPELNQDNKRDIYLPEGKWIDMNTGDEHVVGASGKWIKNYNVPLSVVPVFYNVNNTSKTAPGLYDAVIEALEYARSCEP